MLNLFSHLGLSLKILKWLDIHVAIEKKWIAIQKYEIDAYWLQKYEWQKSGNPDCSDKSIFLLRCIRMSNYNFQILNKEIFFYSIWGRGTSSTRFFIIKKVSFNYCKSRSISTIFDYSQMFMKINKLWQNPWPILVHFKHNLSIQKLQLNFWQPIWAKMFNNSIWT